MDKKRGSLLLGIVLIGLLSVSLVSAAGEWAEDVNKFIDDFVNTIEPVAKQVLGNTPSGQYLFAKVLFFIIILAIVFTALNRSEFFSENVWVLWVLSAVVSILATRFLTTEGLINTLLLPYSTLGVAVSAGLPFVLYFLIINVGLSEPGHKLIRRIAWIFFAIIFIFLYITRLADSKFFGNAAWIYPLTALVAFVMVVMDGTINRFFIQLKLEKAGKQTVQELETELRRKINQANADFAAGIITQRERDKRIKNYKKTISGLHK